MTASPAPSERALQLLIADDSWRTAQDTAGLLRLSLPVEIATAGDGAECLAKALACRPDAMLIDLRMPRLDGAEVARRVRKHYGDRSPHLIALTGYTLHGHDLPWLDQLFDRALAKPLDVAALVAALKHVAAGIAPRSAPTPAPAATEAPMPGPGPDRPEVLLVDDKRNNRAIGRGMLESLGCLVRTVHDGLDAIDQCRLRPPRLVLMDLDMPVLPGLAAAARLRELQRCGVLPPFPVVAATADATPEAEAACVAVGMDGFLTKPLNLGSLREQLQRLLHAS